MDGNQPIIDEFRANGGRVGGPFEGASLLLLTTRGRNSGWPHTTPAVHLRDGARYLVFATNAGASHHPDWYHNLLAHPQVTFEIGASGAAEGLRTYAARAVPLAGEERDHWYGVQERAVPRFRAYREATSRVIPVVALHPIDLAGDPALARAGGAHLLAAHAQLRDQLAEVRAVLDGPGPDGVPETRATLGEQLRQHCLAYCHGLRMHHISENGAFTALEDAFPHLAQVIGRLREEHRAVEESLTELAALLDQGPNAARERLRAQLERTVAGLEEHFAREEAELLPALVMSRPG
ncbi:nitroreductase/quinone reductase family protein [Streptomyces sp. B6B3]|uniref:nitroreductase/quinone reductase family protein n=1 Tax=Streptomyces sp. B6B3 TaxID=3153570 RepID=UPI00325C4E48